MLPTCDNKPTNFQFNVQRRQEKKIASEFSTHRLYRLPDWPKLRANVIGLQLRTQSGQILKSEGFNHSNISDQDRQDIAVGSNTFRIHALNEPHRGHRFSIRDPTLKFVGLTRSLGHAG